MTTSENLTTQSPCEALRKERVELLKKRAAGGIQKNQQEVDKIDYALAILDKLIKALCAN